MPILTQQTNGLPYLTLDQPLPYPSPYLPLPQTLSNNLFSITLKLLDRFTSNIQVTLSLTQKTIWSPLCYGHAWT